MKDTDAAVAEHAQQASDYIRLGNELVAALDELDRLKEGIEAKKRAFRDRLVLHKSCDLSAEHECRLAIAALEALILR